MASDGADERLPFLTLFEDVNLSLLTKKLYPQKDIEPVDADEEWTMDYLYKTVILSGSASDV